MQEINDAYALIRAYCHDYHFSFSRQEFFEQNLRERLRVQFDQEPF